MARFGVRWINKLVDRHILETVRFKDSKKEKARKKYLKEYKNDDTIGGR